MKISNTLKTLPLVAAALALGATGVNAAHQVTRGGLGKTYVAPYYCLLGSDATPDVTSSFSSIVSNRHRLTVLDLAIPANSNSEAAFASVANNGGPSQAFSTLSFDVSDVNPLTEIEIYVAQDNGLTDGGYATFSTIATAPTASTPRGWTHCVATRTNLQGNFDESEPIGPSNVFLYAALIQFNDGQARSTHITNINLNNNPTNAIPVLRPAENNCFITVI